MPYRAKDIVHSLGRVAGAVRVSVDPSARGSSVDEGLVKIDHASQRLANLEQSGSEKLVNLGDDAAVQALAADVDQAIKLMDAGPPKQDAVRIAFERSLDLTDRIQSILEGEPTTDPFGEDHRGSSGDATTDPFEEHPACGGSILEGDPTTEPLEENGSYKDASRPAG